MATLPAKGQSEEEIRAYFDGIDSQDPDHAHSTMSAFCMEGSPDMQDVLHKAYFRYFHHNGIIRRMQPGVVQMENDLRTICADLLSGGTEGVAANITSGGTESIFCAVHAMREWARDTRPGTAIEMIAPSSAHPAFSKACHYLDIKLIRVPVGPDHRADVDAMAAAIGPNTAAIMGSAPCWPYGRYDAIEAIAAVAVERGIWMHVDACVGGFIAPFMAEAGYPLPTEWDFRVPGVMSISADLHKYGYAAKPASIVAWRSDALLKYHHFTSADWSGTPYHTEAFTGSRPIGAVAGAYAMLNYLGREGYVRLARQAMRNKQRLLDGVAAIPGLAPFPSDMVLTYYGSDDPALPVEKIVGGMREAGWTSFGTPEPPLIQLAVSPFPEDGSLIDRYLDDLRRVVARIRQGDRVQLGELKYTD